VISHAIFGREIPDIELISGVNPQWCARFSTLPARKGYSESMIPFLFDAQRSKLDERWATARLLAVP
jgi:hypothetical protein